MYNATYIRYDKSHWGKTNKGGGRGSVKQIRKGIRQQGQIVTKVS